VNSSVLNGRRVERFAQLLDEADGVRRHHHGRSTLDDEMSNLVSLGHSLTAATPEVHIRDEFRRDLRAMLIATAERDGIGSTAVAEPAVGRARVTAAGTSRSGARSLLPKQLQPRPKTSGPRITTRRGRTRGAILVGLAVGTLALSGISAASGDAQPGDALYNVKRQAENAQLLVAGSNSSKGQLYLQFAQRRMNEAESVRTSSHLLTGVLGDMDSQTTLGVRLLFTDAVKHHDLGELKIIDDFVTAQEAQIPQLEQGLVDPSRSRVLTSFNLLNAIHTRSADLHKAFACATSTVNRPADNLGAQLVCPESSPVTPNSTPGGKSGGKTTTTKPGSHTSTNTPSGVVSPASTPATSSGNDTATTPNSSPTSDGGLLGDVERLLGGL
jgi:Domain of unknown function (DUF5667)